MNAAVARAVSSASRADTELLKPSKASIETAMVLLVGLGDQRRDLLERGEDRELFAVRVPLQHLVEEPEPLHGRLEPGLPACRVERGGVDDRHVGSERIVNRHYRIDRTGHAVPL